MDSKQRRGQACIFLATHGLGPLHACRPSVGRGSPTWCQGDPRESWCFYKVL